MKKILVIEDNTEVRENLCELLDLANYKTYQAENGKIGIQAVKLNNPDLIICDVMMPELDGFGVLRILSRDPQYMTIPFMFLTAKAEKTDFRKGMGLGADDYITKPFDEVELMDAIEMRLRKSQKVNDTANDYRDERSFYSKIKAEKAFVQLSKGKEIRSYSKKSIIYREGQYPKYVYKVLSGSVKVTQINEVGKELITNICGPGDFIGLVSLVKESAYHESAICIEEAEVLLLPSEDFKMLLFKDKDFNALLLKTLVDHTFGTEIHLLDIAFSSVRKKVANALLMLSNKNNSLLLSYSREDLAGIAGTSRESVIRTLSDFRNEGLIETGNAQINILNKEKLEKLPQ